MKSYTMNDINPLFIDCFHTNQSNCPPMGTDYGKRQVKWYELELILWGEGSIITEGKRISARKGDIFFRTPGMVVQGFSPYYCYLVVFDMFANSSRHACIDSNPLNSDNPTSVNGTLPAASINVEDMHLPYVMNSLQYNDFEKLFSSIYEEHISRRKESPFFIKTYLMQILLMLYKELAYSNRIQYPNRSIYQNYSKIMKVKSHIDSNPHSRFRLNDLAGIAELSPNFFCKIFKEIVGETPINYINKNRINMAKKLLIETNMDIKLIAHECGFENDTYFFKLFKRFEGISPSIFKERQQMVTLLRGR